MNKLSDEKFEAMFVKHISDTTGYYGMLEIKKYYDAQIDAQAKTMEELWNAYCNSSRYDNAIDFAFHKIKRKIQTFDAECFSEAVGFFLATGGTIKDGE